LPLDLLPNDYRLFGIDTDTAEIEDAPPDSTANPRNYGDAWLASGRTALLRITSVIVPEESNVLINPLHPQAQLIQVVSERAFGFDPRLF
jgi:RES domain-containing protein